MQEMGPHTPNLLSALRRALLLLCLLLLSLRFVPSKRSGSEAEQMFACIDRQQGCLLFAVGSRHLRKTIF